MGTSVATGGDAGEKPLRAAAEGATLGDVVRLAVCCGTLSGLVEGAMLIWAPELRLQEWFAIRSAVSARVFWFNPLFAALLFTCIGLPAWLLFRWFARPYPIGLALALDVFVMSFTWLSLLWRINYLPVFIFSLGTGVAAWRWAGGRPQSVRGAARRGAAVALAGVALLLAGIEGAGQWSQRNALRGLPAAPAGAPNVIVIVIDTLRADHLSSYGYARPTSPNMDGLARRGVLFERAISTSSWTLPAHASLLTGALPHVHGAERNPYDGRLPSLAQVLSARGYRTLAVSANFSFFTKRAGFGDGFVHFDDVSYSLRNLAWHTLYGLKLNDHFGKILLGYRDEPGRRWSPSVMESTLDWLGTKSDRPFFVFLNMYDPHAEYVVDEPYRSRFAKQPRPKLNLIGRWRNRWTPVELDAQIEAYDGAISLADESIGRMLAGMESRGLLQNTLVIVTSDHGEAFNEHGFLGHWVSLNWEVLHVPLILTWKGRLPEGLRIPQPVGIDSVPTTVLTLLNYAAPASFAGPSLEPLWRDPATPSNRMVISEIVPQGAMPPKSPAAQGWMKSIVYGDWHYVLHETLGEELFHRPTDPLEKTNRVNEPASRDVLKQMREEIARRFPGLLRAAAQAPGPRP